MTHVPDFKKGVMAGIGAYLLWGFLPIYWKTVDHIPATEILAHRIVWSFFFLLILFVATRKLPYLLEDLRYLKTHPKIIVNILLSSILISANWILFIWAVANERIVEVSLGYYINPLINVILGVIFFKETLSTKQRSAVGLAFIGVLIMTLSFGQVPYIALTLAFSFGLYGLVKKQTQVGSMTGLSIETLMMFPIAVAFLFYTHGNVSGILHTGSDVAFTPLLLIGTGAATAVPLLLFGFGARNISLSLIGFLQYIAPTSMLLLGVLLYGEAFTVYHAFSFVFIWTGLILYSISKFKAYQAEKRLLQQAK
ncbi:EamA family transporter RarD [Salisediminibacterium selenitireducens]|uniref:RarD protein, DMT superfamily transporter n=1 Tax=Bacillus selenitireducens (strain ATCC 700615 / DSM 15326 / MLS10) TaxID=439292 RepID=D6XZ13_BACIE|nr:EamA family transporter RarD [Salisediminibacterium selenitireducens]ADI00298.1 RarD protein, DMT superfamily transporter [[Bacillus] selenitireducens MLS10]